MRPFSSLLFVCLICSQLHSTHAGEFSRTEYIEFIQSSSKFLDFRGDYTKGEIEIVTDPQTMAAIEKNTGRDVGIVMKDKYWIWTNDACIFPNGTTGVYGRILWVKSLEGVPGVAVMPMTADGKVVLNCNFRHATRSWEIELPRGGLNSGEAPEAAARRETAEETGMLVEELIFLGEMPPDTGLTNTIVPIYMAKVIGKEDTQQEDSEAIEDILYLTMGEIKQAFVRGYLEHTIRGVHHKIPFRDPFLAYAIFMYDLKSPLL